MFCFSLSSPFDDGHGSRGPLFVKVVCIFMVVLRDPFKNHDEDGAE